LRKSDKENIITTELQEKILKHICETRNADYKSISKATGRDRITILQSLQPLMKRQYIYKQKIDPDRIKSKLIFKPTDKGKYYALAYLDLDYEDMIKANLDVNDISKYNEFIKSIPDYTKRKEIIYNTAKLAVEHNIFNKKGKLIASGSPEEIFQQGLKLSLLESVRNKDFNAKSYFNIESIESLAKVTTPDELKEMKGYLMNMRNNLDLIIDQFPD
jgi:predicted transcriptional regulator